MLTMTLATLLATPTADAGRFDTDGLRCTAGNVAFDGACRAVDWFDDLARSGWTLESVVGCDVIGDCEHALLLEVKDDGTKVRALVVTEDRSVASSNDRDGYPVVRRVVHTDLGDSLHTKVVALDGSGTTVLFDGLHDSSYGTGGSDDADALTDVAVGTLDFEEIKVTLHLGGQDFWLSLGGQDFWLLGVQFELQM